MAKLKPTISDLEVWRVPDEEGDNWAVWYGPEGPEGDVASAIARIDRYQYRFGEVQDIRLLVDVPPDSFLVTVETIDLDDVVQKTLRIDGDDARRRLDQMPEQKKLRMAAAVASALIPQFGGEEKWAPSLADGLSQIV